MDFPIEGRICSEPNAFFRSDMQAMKRAGYNASGPAVGRVLRWVVLLAAAVFGVSPASGQAPSPSYVDHCRPCTFSVGGDAGVYSFTFELKSVPHGRVVEAIDVVKDSKTLQRLQVSGMEPVDKDEQFFFGGVDLNFDGYADLMLITRKGVANAYAMYWLFDPKAGAFTELGTHPVFRIDAEKHRLSTYERGGSGGMIHEEKQYGFVDGKLVLMREEKQSATARPGVFRKVVRELKGGVMETVESKDVRAPARESH